MQLTAKYLKINSGYMGQIIEWPEVITEAETIEECRIMLKDALTEMIKAHQFQGIDLPISNALFESLSVETENVG
jgi:predicted RNase H-like HicB family nuclease